MKEIIEVKHACFYKFLYKVEECYSKTTKDKEIIIARE